MLVNLLYPQRVPDAIVIISICTRKIQNEIYYYFFFFSIKAQENGRKEKRETKFYSMKDVIEFNLTVIEKFANEFTES